MLSANICFDIGGSWPQTPRQTGQNLHGKRCWISAFIPLRKHRKQPRDFDRHILNGRHLTDGFVGKTKRYPGIFSYFEQTARNYMSFLGFAAAPAYLRQMSTEPRL